MTGAGLAGDFEPRPLVTIVSGESEGIAVDGGVVVSGNGARRDDGSRRGSGRRPRPGNCPRPQRPDPPALSGSPAPRDAEAGPCRERSNRRSVLPSSRAKPQMAQNEVGHPGDVVKLEHRQRVGLGTVGGDRHDPRERAGERLPATPRPPRRISILGKVSRLNPSTSTRSQGPRWARTSAKGSSGPVAELAHQSEANGR